jgi:hypothetical protein
MIDADTSLACRAWNLARLVRLDYAAPLSRPQSPGVT